MAIPFYDRARHDQMVTLVERMVALQRRLVYELYGLTEEEIRIVEKGSP